MTILKFHLGLMLALSLFLSSVVPSNVYAATTKNYKMTPAQVSASVEEVFQKFQYAIAVEWDQKDETFKDNAERELVKGLLALIESGVTLEEIQSYMQKTLLSEHAQKHYQRLIDAMKTQNLSTEEITAKTMQFMNQMQAQGVNFNGEGVMHGSRWGIIVVVIVVVVVTHLVLKGGKDHHDHDHDYDHDHDHDWDYDHHYNH